MFDSRFHPSKKMGQNFLVNDKVAKRIADLIDESYDCVIEIGPGYGALTKFLSSKKHKIIGIELDKRLCEYLRNHFKNVEIINNDILNVDLDSIFNQYKSPILISNLPYSISSPFLFKYLSLKTNTPFICMLQKDFVDRITAKPHTKQYGGLSVITQTYSHVKQMMVVGPENFQPPPKIESTVIEISKNNASLNDQFNDFVRRCFLAKRKTIFNNLKSQFNHNKINDALSVIQVGIKARAEEISPTQFMQLYKLLNNGTQSI